MAKSKPATITKAEFAAQIGVSRHRVNVYLREGRIDGAAVVRLGREVRIHSSIAKRQLADRLAAPTSGRRLTGANVDAVGDGDDAALNGGTTINSRLKAALLRKRRLANARLEAEMAVLAGRYVETAAVEQLGAATITMTLDVFEAQIPALVEAVADTFHVPRDEVAAIAADAMRSIRKRATAERRTGNGKGH